MSSTHRYNPAFRASSRQWALPARNKSRIQVESSGDGGAILDNFHPLCMASMESRNPLPSQITNVGRASQSFFLVSFTFTHNLAESFDYAAHCCCIQELVDSIDTSFDIKVKSIYNCVIVMLLSSSGGFFLYCVCDQ